MAASRQSSYESHGPAPQGQAAEAARADGGLWPKIGKTSAHYLRIIARSGRSMRWALTKPTAVRPVFVVGCSRGGTTLVYKTLSESPELGSLQRESHPYWSSLQPLERRDWHSHALSARDASERDRLAASRFFFVGTGKRRFVDKNNQHGLAIPYLYALFPDAHFVYVKRNPGDNINSLMEGWRRVKGFGAWSENLPGEVAVDGGRCTRWCFFLPPGWRSYLNASLETVCAYQYRSMNDAILDARDGIPPAQWSELCYEDLLADPVGEFRRVFEEADLRFDEPVRQHCEQVLSTPYNAFSEIRKDKWLQSPDAARIRSVLDDVANVAGRMGYSAE